MVDKIKPLKMETAISGTEVDPFPTEADPTEDFVATKGIAVENSDAMLLTKIGPDDELGYYDEGQPAGKKFNDIILNAGSSRMPVVFGYNGNAANKFLEVFASVPSDSTPFVISEIGTIKAHGFSSNAASTATVTLYKNGVSVATLSKTGNTAYDSAININVLPSDELSAKVTSGTASNVVYYVTIRTE